MNKSQQLIKSFQSFLEDAGGGDGGMGGSGLAGGAPTPALGVDNAGTTQLSPGCTATALGSGDHCISRTEGLSGLYLPGSIILGADEINNLKKHIKKHAK